MKKKLKLSVIVISYNMKRELPRTLISLSTLMQQDICKDDYEVIIVDNGSNNASDLKHCTKIQNNFSLQFFKNPSHSPVNAINYGLEIAKGELIGVMIDGARMASPRILASAIEASNLFEEPIIGAHGFHLGPEVQMQSTLKGYNQEKEDKLLSSIDWQKDGYRLFKISVFAGSSTNGWFILPLETNAIFLKQNLWKKLNGYEASFKSPGGGLANLDIWKRACTIQNGQPIILLGEGTFHQIHGGIATNAKSPVLPRFHEEYYKIRNENYSKPTNKPFFYGRLNPYLHSSIEFSSKIFSLNQDEFETQNKQPQSKELKDYSLSHGNDESGSKEHYLNILTKLHQHLNPYNYLEIGVRHGDSLRLARINGIGIDPQPDIKFHFHEKLKLYKMTSDEFFNTIQKKIKYKIDFAFIDGMHLFEFALKDFINIEKYSSKTSFVVLDDIFPNKKCEAQRDRTTQVWTGDIWKIYYCLKKFRPDLSLFPIDSYPTGMLLIYNLDSHNQILSEKYNQITKRFLKINRVPNDILKRKMSCASSLPEIETILNQVQLNRKTITQI
jgi:glycosyltransferase involved in cell wall biosynthesis